MLETETRVGILDRPTDETLDNSYGFRNKPPMAQAKPTGRWVTVTGEIKIGKELHLIGFSYHTRGSIGPDCSKAKQQFLNQFQDLIPQYASLRDIEARTVRKESSSSHRHGFFPKDDI